MVRLITVNIIFIVFFCSSTLYAQDNRVGGPNTTLNHDYFYPNHSAQTKWMFGTIEKYHIEYAIRYMAEERIDEAIKDAVYALDRVVNHPQALAVIGSLARVTKNPVLAINYYEKALKLYPQYALTHAQYGWYLADIGSIDAGVVQLKEAIEIDPKLVIAHAWLAKAYSKNGNLELARQALEQARQLGYRDKAAGQGQEDRSEK